MMKRTLLILLLSPFLMPVQDNGKATEEEFNKHIIGRWKVVEISLDGANNNSSAGYFHEYSADTVFYDEYTGVEPFGTWRFYAKSQTLITEEFDYETVKGFSFNYFTPDSMEYEQPTVNGMRREKWIKVK